mmetsp:Transcript_24642/g.79657  ORF Transcript_24642/g.79657 Transcript_24642/m.79657 type:complete len:255 (+) Transcript_24642:2022-2786(+)
MGARGGGDAVDDGGRSAVEHGEVEESLVDADRRRVALEGRLPEFLEEGAAQSQGVVLQSRGGGFLRFLPIGRRRRLGGDDDAPGRGSRGVTTREEEVDEAQDGLPCLELVRQLQEEDGDGGETNEADASAVDAPRVGAPRVVDVGAVLQEEAGDVEVEGRVEARGALVLVVQAVCRRRFGRSVRFFAALEGDEMQRRDAGVGPAAEAEVARDVDGLGLLLEDGLDEGQAAEVDREVDRLAIDPAPVRKGELRRR